MIAFNTVKMKGEIVFFLRCTRLPRLPSFTLLYYSKAVLQEHGSVCVFFPLLAICRCAKVFLEAKWAEKNNEKAFFFLFIFLCFTRIWDTNGVIKIQIGASKILKSSIFTDNIIPQKKARNNHFHIWKNKCRINQIRSTFRH